MAIANQRKQTPDLLWATPSLLWIDPPAKFKLRHYPILTSVGAGGTGYLAGTLGGVGATFLGIASAAVVIAGVATAGIAGAGAYAWCRYHR